MHFRSAPSHCTAALLATIMTLGSVSPSFARETATGQDKGQQEEDEIKPVKGQDVTPTDIATTPINDLNLRKKDIPELLLTAMEKPYDLDGMTRCAKIRDAVLELDAVLGDDVDLERYEKKGPNAGKLAQWFVGTFIPFRGALRELTGANEHQRRLGAAIEAGIARRSFLKGAGQARGCAYPARSATPEVIAAHGAANQPDDDDGKKKKDAADKATTGKAR